MKKVFSLLGLMLLTGCHIGQDGVVIQTFPNGSQKCWFLKNQYVIQEDNNIQWKKGQLFHFFSNEYSVQGNVSVVLRRFNEFSNDDFLAQAKELGIHDPSQCVVVE